MPSKPAGLELWAKGSCQQVVTIKSVNQQKKSLRSGAATLHLDGKRAASKRSGANDRDDVRAHTLPLEAAWALGALPEVGAAADAADVYRGSGILQAYGLQVT